MSCSFKKDSISLRKSDILLIPSTITIFLYLFFIPLLLSFLQVFSILTAFMLLSDNIILFFSISLFTLSTKEFMLIFLIPFLYL